jgi:redox-sensitive bicupin YhaK (pirin superfamily)
VLEPGKSLDYSLSQNRYGWLQVTRGSVTVNGKQLNAGDGAAIEKEEKLAIANTGKENAEFLLFDLA